MRRGAAAVLVLLVVLPVCLVDAANARRIVAIGDIHGAEEALHTILRRAELVDKRWRWTGGDAVLVQTGDMLDRGEDAVSVLKRLMDLQERAANAGGKVVVLLGNHEIMNILGDRRDVTARIVHPFSSNISKARLVEECRDRAPFIERLMNAQGDEPPPTRELRKQCVLTTPLGWLEYIRDLGPDGKLGRWLRGLPAVVEIEGTVFVHGGISPRLAELGVEEIDRRVHRELEAFDRYRAWLVESSAMPESASLVETLRATMGVVGVQLVTDGEEPPTDPSEDAAEAKPWQGEPPEDLASLLDLREWLLQSSDGPFWFRGYALWEEAVGREEVPKILEGLNAKHLVVGHTPQSARRIQARWDGRVFLIDTGMLAEVYKGQPAALEIEDGRFKALYLDGEEVIWPLPSSPPPPAAR